MTDLGERQADRAAIPAAKPKWKPGLVETLAVLLALNMVATVCLTVRSYRDPKPTVVTVGVSQLAREYVSRVATAPNMTPQEIELRTKLFMAVAQDAVKRASTQKGVIVMPRECVLAGEYADVTPEVGKAVNAELDKSSLPKSAAASPAAQSSGARLVGLSTGGQP